MAYQNFTRNAYTTYQERYKISDVQRIEGLTCLSYCQCTWLYKVCKYIIQTKCFTYTWYWQLVMKADDHETIKCCDAPPNHFIQVFHCAQISQKCKIKNLAILSVWWITLTDSIVTPGFLWFSRPRNSGKL